MKIYLQSKVTIVGKNAREYQKKDGSGVARSCSVAIMQDGQCANVPCTEEVHDAVLVNPEMPIDIDVVLGGFYNDSAEFKPFQFDRVLQHSKVK